MGLHLHITDGTGDGLLLEGTPDGGFATYDTRECRTAPAPGRRVGVAPGPGPAAHPKPMSALLTCPPGHHGIPPSAAVLTNEPSFPAMKKWAAAYTGYDFSAVPGIANARECCAAQPCPALALVLALPPSLTAAAGDAPRTLQPRCRLWSPT